MAKWETPRHLTGTLASRADRSGMTGAEVKTRTCRHCAGVFTNVASRQACEEWHRTIFRRMRNDLSQAIDRINKDLTRGVYRSDSDAKEAAKQLGRLADQLRQVPQA